jgi:hypothetical protein
LNTLVSPGTRGASPAGGGNAAARARAWAGRSACGRAFLGLGFLVAFLAVPLAGAQNILYPKIEASFNVTGLSTNPVVLFDYTQTDVEVTLLQPNSNTITLPAFYDGGTLWRVRHAPAMPGAYSVSKITLNGAPVSVANLQPASWLVAGQPTDPGYIQVDPANPHRFITGNGQRFFPKGQDVAWDVNSHTVTNLFPRLGAAHENWSRVWMDAWDGKNLDWNSDGTSPGPLGDFSLTVARKWDSIVSAAEQAGVHFQMTLHHHGEYSSTVDPNWPQNPYNISNTASTIGFLTNATQFFTNATAISVTQRKLRYAIARWGYSSSVMAWELFNEVQYTDAAQQGLWTIVGAWHDQMASFLHTNDPYHHLVTTSSDLTEPIWDNCDYYTHHDYPSDVVSGLRDATDITASQPVKPDYGAECATNGTPDLGIDAPLWAGLMAAQSGNEEPWWWDTIDYPTSYGYFRSVSDFVTLSGLADQDGLVQSAPTTTGGALGPLTFGLGGGWATASQSTFTVGAVAPDGVGSAPSYLQGEYHRSMTPNGYTFLVDYPAAGTFAVQVVEIASSGAGLQISVDGTLQTNISWPSSTNGDVSTNFTASIPVSAGSHSILLWDPGLDWINLGNITLNPYSPSLAAYAIGNTNFFASWVWNTSNLFYTNASVPATGTLSVTGLNPGTYAANWWDTFVGGAVSNFTLVVANTNPVVVGTPPVLRSAALYVGAPPRAGLAAPSLVQTLGTNSPAAAFLITLTNGGGLPLGYSLCVTGASPVSYSALNSTQTAGPWYAWKDISSIGSNITAFTALAPPKSALDEGIAGPFNIGFGFPFFSGYQSPTVVTQVYLSPNGFIAFSPFAGDTSTNTAFPGASAPSNCIAFFWRDLDLSAGGNIYTASDTINGTFTVQFQGARFKSSSSTVTCQVILKTTGEIVMQYQSLSSSNTCTVGVQSANAAQGLTVVSNANYLQALFAIRLTPTPWISLSANAGFVSQGRTNAVTATLNPAGLTYGTNRATLLLSTSDATQPLFSLPLELDLTPLATWRQTWFGTAADSGNAADAADPAGDGLVNIVKYAFGLNPTVVCQDPISFELAGQHLVVWFNRPHPAPSDISYLFEISSNLTSATWNSGSNYTSQAITNNGNGTETVTVTDLTPIASTSAHYLRVQIAH